MALSGYYGGYLQALATASGVESQAVQRQVAQQQMMMRQDEFHRQGQERDILASVFNSQAQSQQDFVLIQQTDLLAQQYKQAGRALMGVNPKDAMAFMREGDAVQTRAAEGMLAKLKVEDARGDLLGAIAGGVRDQVSLDEARDRMATLGMALPSQFSQWNEGTQQYLEGMQRFSIPAHQQRMLEIQKLTAGVNAQAKEQRVALEREKLDLRARGEAMKQTGVKGVKMKPVSRAAQESELDVMTTLEGGEFLKDADEGVRQDIAQRVQMYAEQYMLDSTLKGQGITKAEALEAARMDVLGEYGKVGGVELPVIGRVGGKVGRKVEGEQPVAPAPTASGLPPGVVVRRKS